MQRRDKIRLRPRRCGSYSFADIPQVTDIQGLVFLAQSGVRYTHLDVEMLWRILPQLLELNEMVGMEKLKETLFYQIIYYLQNLATDEDNDFMHTVITGAPGSGKCLGPGTRVRLHSGKSIAVEDIREGDLLLGDDGDPRHVRCLSTGVGERFLVSYPGGHFLANREHVLTVQRRDSAERIDISIREFRDRPEEWQNEHLGVRVCVPKVRAVDGPDGYAVGFVASRVFEFDNVSTLEVHNDVIRKYLREKGVVCEGVRPEHLPVRPDAFASCPEVLRGLFPRAMGWGDPRYCQDLLAGVLDGVGTYSAFFDSCSLFFQLSQHGRFFPAVCELLHFLCIPYTRRDHCYELKIGSEEPTTIACVTICIDHVSDRIGSVRNGIPHPPVRESELLPLTIEPADPGAYHGFELDGNGRFVLADGVVTHNTSIAKIIGELYRGMGVLSIDGEFRIAKREDFVAEYLGQSAMKTKRLLEKCIGGVLFIDEVYALGPKANDSDSFSKEAIDTLNTFLSEHSHEFCCIVAGYERDVEDSFFSVNQGLRRRFQWVHRIEKYSSSHLVEIFHKLVAESLWEDQVCDDVLIRCIEENPTLFEAFGGDIANLFTKCKLAHAHRLMSEPRAEKRVLKDEDLLEGIELLRKHRSGGRADIAPEHMYL